MAHLRTWRDSIHHHNRTRKINGTSSSKSKVNQKLLTQKGQDYLVMTLDVIVEYWKKTPAEVPQDVLQNLSACVDEI